MPMILMGDEIRRTQGGNNNAYCYDDANNWMDWGLLEKHADVHRFTKLLIARRLLRDVQAEHQRKSLDQLLREARKAWHGVKVEHPDWSDWSHSLALGAELRKQNLFFQLMMNAYWEPLEFKLPSSDDRGGNPWRRWIDTGFESPLDIVEWQTAPAISGQTYRVEARSVVMLFRTLDA
jgi:glycogen operon protein